jgi:peptidoglycan/LPS O-acetylase OafA/YrhL
VFIGVIGYGLYLPHMLCANTVRRLLHFDNCVLLFAATLVTVIAAAYLSFRFFEAPLLTLKRRFESGGQREGDALSRAEMSAGSPTR